MPPSEPVKSTNTPASGKPEKTREEIMAEREAKKLAKQAKKSGAATSSTTTTATVAKSQTSEESTKSSNTSSLPAPAAPVASESGEKSREQIKAEREAKKLAKQAAKAAKKGGDVVELLQKLAELKVATGAEGDKSKPLEQATPATELGEKKKPVLTKAERRAIQEAQRAAKAQAQKGAPTGKGKPADATATAVPKTPLVVDKTPSKTATASSPKKSSPFNSKTNQFQIKLFNHLETPCRNINQFANNPQIPPCIARLGEQYAKRTIVGSNARCIAFLNALKTVIKEHRTPPNKEYGRSLETSIKHCVEYLHKCRPLAVSVSNAHKHIKHVLTQLPADESDYELSETLLSFVDTYMENQIEKAVKAISLAVQEKIADGDVLLTFGCSSLIHNICEESKQAKVDFRVIVVDARPFCEGQELLRRLTASGIRCTYVLINAVGFVMPEATKVLLGAHALLSNGYVMARTGTAQVALVARAFNVPVLVCCETHKFSERFQTDAIVYNELGNPDDLIPDANCSLTNWQAKNKMSLLNLIYDITPPELVTAVVTEVSILPCTSVPVILRIKPTDFGY